MNRRNKFVIGFLAAAITYGALMAFVGPRHGFYGHHRFRDQECPRHHTHGGEKIPEQKPAAPGE